MSLGSAPTKGNQKLAINATKKDILLATAQTLLRPVAVADPNATSLWSRSLCERTSSRIHLDADKRVTLQGMIGTLCLQVGEFYDCLTEHALKTLAMIRDEILVSIAAPFVTLVEERAI